MTEQTDLRQRDVEIVNGEVVLAGTWTTLGDSPSQAVVMVGGSGASDRDNDTLFPPIREHLVRAGIAVLSYDKRGVGASTGDWLATTMADLAGDAAAARAHLRAELPEAAVGLFGHSEGGWLVLRAASGRDDVPFVVTTGCPAVTPARQNRFALASALRAAAVSPADAESALAAYDELVLLGRRDADFSDVEPLLAGRGGRVFRTAYWDLGMDQWDFEKRKQDHDPVPDLLGLHCPYLAMYGGADPLVPVSDSVGRFAAVAGEPGRDPRFRFEAAVFPGADHRLRLPDGAFAPGFLDTLARWIGARGGARPGRVDGPS